MISIVFYRYRHGLSLLCFIILAINPSIGISKEVKELYNTSDPANQDVVRAVFSGDKQWIKDLVDQGSDLNLVNNSEYRDPILLVIASIASVADSKDTTERLVFSSSPLIPPYFDWENFDWEEMFRFCIQIGADVNIRDDQGRTLLMKLINNTLYKYAEIIIRDYKADVHTQSKDGVTAIELAIQKNSGGIVKLLIDLGIDPNQLTSDRVPLLVKAMKDRYPSEDVVGILVSAGASIDGIEQGAINSTSLDRKMVDAVRGGS